MLTILIWSLHVVYMYQIITLCPRNTCNYYVSFYFKKRRWKRRGKALSGRPLLSCHAMSYWCHDAVKSSIWSPVTLDFAPLQSHDSNKPRMFIREKRKENLWIAFVPRINNMWRYIFISIYKYIHFVIDTRYFFLICYTYLWIKTKPVLKTIWSKWCFYTAQS